MGKISPSPINTALRQLSDAQFQKLGMEEVAYLRPVVHEGTFAVGIHAADGTPMAVVPDEATALAAIHDHDMSPATIH